MNSKNIISIAFISFITCCCHANKFNEKELQNYINNPDSGLTDSVRTADIQFIAQYQPAGILAIRELSQSIAGDSINFNNLKTKYNEDIYILLKISKNGSELLQPSQGFSSYSQLLQTLAFNSQSIISVITANGDTLRPSNYIVDRTYGMGSATQILFSFPKNKNTSDLSFIVREFGLGTGSLRFEFKNADMKRVEVLEIQP